MQADQINEAYETCLLEGDETILMNLIEKTGKNKKLK